jgi:hypothetical protein
MSREEWLASLQTFDKVLVRREPRTPDAVPVYWVSPVVLTEGGGIMLEGDAPGRDFRSGSCGALSIWHRDLGEV